MSNCTRYLGLDVHAETITAAIAEGRGKIRSLGKVPNRSEAVRKFIEKLGGNKDLKVCYEAGPGIGMGLDRHMGICSQRNASYQTLKVKWRFNGLCSQRQAAKHWSP